MTQTQVDEDNSVLPQYLEVFSNKSGYYGSVSHNVELVPGINPLRQ